MIRGGIVQYDDGRRWCNQHGVYEAYLGCPACLKAFSEAADRAIKSAARNRRKIEAEIAELAAMWEMP